MVNHFHSYLLFGDQAALWDPEIKYATMRCGQVLLIFVVHYLGFRMTFNL